MTGFTKTFHKNRSLFLFLIGLIIIFAVIILLWKPLLTFLIGFLIAYLLHPIVEWLNKKLPAKGKHQAVQRISIVIVILILILLVICAIIYGIAFSIADAYTKFIHMIPSLITDGLHTVGDWLESWIKDLTPEQQHNLNNAINKISEAVGNWLQNAFSIGLSFVLSTFPFILGLFILPFFLIFFMSNINNISKGFYSLFDSDINRHIKNFLDILDSVFGRYIKATLAAALIMGSLTAILFLIVKVPLAPILGFIFGIFQLIPTIGGAIGTVIGLLVIIAMDPSKFIVALIIYILMNLVVSTVLLAKLQGSAVKIDPAIVMILIILGGYIGGILGMILIVPLTAVVYALIKYIRAEIRQNALIANSNSSEN